MRVCQGFSLLELMIVLAIIAVFSTLTAFFSQNLLNNNAASTHINNLAGAVQLARNEAILGGEMVTLCHSEDAKVCGGEWQDGQLVFVDRNANRQVDSEDNILRVWPALAKGATLRWQAFGATHSLQFQPTGFTNGQNGTFIYCPSPTATTTARGLIVAQSGRVRFTQADANGQHLDNNAEPLNCAK